MKILVTGGSGQLGRALTRLAPEQHTVMPLDSHACNVTDFASVEATLHRELPDLIIHAGALTDVDGCEREPELAFRVNALGTQHVAALAHRHDAALVYISTNYVFSGESDIPYHEFDEPAPLSVYGRSKLAGERAVRALAPRHYIVRTAMIYDEMGRNFVNTMLRAASSRRSLNGVDDQIGNPTYAADLAAAVYRLIERPAYGTYHLTNEGVTSWYGWAKEIFRLAQVDVELTPIPASAYQRLARPPANGALANLAAAGLGITLPPWQDALARCLARRQELHE